MRGCRVSDAHRARRPLVRAAALGVAGLFFLSGCYARLSHPAVNNPIFLGDRMSIGEKPRFTLEDEREKYRDKSINMYLWSLLPTGDEWTARDRIAAPARQARRRLGISSYRAVQIKALEVGASSLFVVFMLAIGSSIEYWGELVEVLAPVEPLQESEAGS